MLLLILIINDTAIKRLRVWFIFSSMNHDDRRYMLVKYITCKDTGINSIVSANY